MVISRISRPSLDIFKEFSPSWNPSKKTQRTAFHACLRPSRNLLVN